MFGLLNYGALPNEAGDERAAIQSAIALQFERNAAAADITLTVQVADTIESTTGSLRGVEVRDLYFLNDPAHPRRFMRLKTTVP